MSLAVHCRWRAAVAATLVLTLASLAPALAPRALAQSRVTQGAPPTFEDLGAFPWALPAVESLSALGVVQGTEPGLFDPQAPTTRAQMAVMLARLFNWRTSVPTAAVAVSPPSFTDSASIPGWALPAVEAAASLGVVRGELGGAFDPSGDVTWAEAAVMVDRAFAYPATPAAAVAGLVAELPAGSVTPSWADHAVANDVRAGALAGLPASLYEPGQPISRAELSVLLFNAAQGEAVNPDLLSGRVTSVDSGGVTLGTALGIRSVSLATDALVFSGSTPSSLAHVRVGDGVSAVLSGGRAVVVQITSVPETASLSGTVTDVAAGQMSLRIGGQLTAVVPLAPGATVTVNGQIASLSSVTAGDTAVAALDGMGRATLVQVSPSGALPASGGSPTGRSSSAASVPAPAPAVGTTGAASSSAAGSIGTAELVPSVPVQPPAGSQAGAGSAGSIASFLLSPNPIAPTGTLAPGQQVRLTLTAVDAAGAAVPDATVYISLAAAAGDGIATAASSYLAPAAQAFTTGPDGRLTILYTAPATLPNGGTDTVTVQNTSSSPTLSSTDTYTYATLPSQIAAPTVARYVFTPDPMAAAGSLQPGQAVSVALTAETSAGLPVPGATVYLSFVPGDPGSSARVDGQPLTSAPQPFTANASGSLTVIYRFASTLAPSGGGDTLTAADAAGSSQVTASDSYYFASPANGVAPGSSLTGLVQSIDGQHVTVLGPGTVSDTLTIDTAPLVTSGGQTVSLSSVEPGDAVTLGLDGSGNVNTITVLHSAGPDETVVSGYLAGIEAGGSGSVLVYTSNSLQTYSVAGNAPVIDQGQASSLGSLPLGDSVAAAIDPSSRITYLLATAAAPPAAPMSGTLAGSPVGGVITLVSGGVSQTVSVGPYAVAVLNGKLQPVTALPPGVQVTVVEGAANYGSALVIEAP